MTSIDRQLAQHIADSTLRHPLDNPKLYKGHNLCEFPPAENAPRFLYAVRHRPESSRIVYRYDGKWVEVTPERRWYEWIDTATGQRVEREDMAGFFEWCQGILEAEHRS